MAEPENKAPAYQWYARDFAADEAVQLMTLEEEGAYHRLLDHQWLHGSIPADVKAIAAVCKNTPPARMKRLWMAMASCFHPVEGDASRLQNRRMERDRIKAQEYRDRQSGRGKAGGEERWRRERERALLDQNDDSASNTQAIAQASPDDSASNTQAILSTWPDDSASNTQAILSTWPDDSSAVCSLQSAPALHPTPPPAREMLRDVEARIPAEYHADLAALMKRVASPISWLAEIGACLDCMANHHAVTGDQAGRAVRDYNANGGEISLRLFRGYLRDASAPPRQQRSNGKRQPPGQYEYTPTTEPVTVR